jgi:WD40 repeat protein
VSKKNLLQAPPTRASTAMQWLDVDLVDTPVVLSWSPQDHALVACTRSGQMFLLNNKGEITWHCEAHEKSIVSASWNKDGTLIATVATDGLCRVWSVTEHSCLFTLPSAEPITHAEWSPWTSLIMTGSGNRINLWTETGKMVDELVGHRFPLTDLNWHPTRRDTFASSAADGLRVWNLADSHPTHSLESKEYPERISFSRNGDNLAFSCNDSSVQVWGMESGIVLKLAGRTGRTSAIDWSWGGQWLSFCSDFEAYLWQFNQRAPLRAKPQALHGSFGRLSHLQFHHYDQLLAAADNEGRVYVWRTDRHDRLTPIATYNSEFATTAIAWSNFARRLSVAFANGHLRLMGGDFNTSRQ